MSSERSISIVGLGAVSPFGSGVDALWRGCLTAQDATERVLLQNAPSLGYIRAATVPLSEGATASVSAILALALQEAMASPFCQLVGVRGRRAGLYLASAHGESSILSGMVDLLVPFDDDPRGGGPSIEASFGQVLWDPVPHHLVERLGFQPVIVRNIKGACASAILAVRLARVDLLADVIDVAVIATGDVLARPGVAGFRQLRALADAPLRPFCGDGDGTVVGEGAVIMIGVRRDPASSPFALAYIAGCGVASDAARHPVHSAEDGNGIERATREALLDARLRPEDVGSVFYHGTGTAQNDQAEAAALNRVFAGSPPPGCAPKAALGHTMGAAAGLSMAIAVKTLLTGFLPPTANIREDDCPLVPLVAMKQHLLENASTTLVNGYGFGGINASVVLASAR